MAIQNTALSGEPTASVSSVHCQPSLRRLWTWINNIKGSIPPLINYLFIMTNNKIFSRKWIFKMGFRERFGKHKSEKIYWSNVQVASSNPLITVWKATLRHSLSIDLFGWISLITFLLCDRCQSHRGHWTRREYCGSDWLCPWSASTEATNLLNSLAILEVSLINSLSIWSVIRLSCFVGIFRYVRNALDTSAPVTLP